MQRYLNEKNMMYGRVLMETISKFSTQIFETLNTTRSPNIRASWSSVPLQGGLCVFQVIKQNDLK